MDSIRHLTHVMNTFGEISSVTFGQGETAMTVELKEASEFTPKGWHIIDSQGTSEAFLIENASNDEFERLLRRADASAKQGNNLVPDLSRRFG